MSISSICPWLLCPRVHILFDEFKEFVAPSARTQLKSNIVSIDVQNDNPRPSSSFCLFYLRQEIVHACTLVRLDDTTHLLELLFLCHLSFSAASSSLLREPHDIKWANPGVLLGVSYHFFHLIEHTSSMDEQKNDHHEAAHAHFRIFLSISILVEEETIGDTDRSLCMTCFLCVSQNQSIILFSLFEA